MKTIKKYFGIISILVALTSCDSFLSQPPDNRTEINTAEKISELLVSAYPEANYMTFCEAMTNNVSDHPGAFTDATNTDPYFFRDVSLTEQDSPEFYWSACYSAIASANQALESIANSEDPSQYDAQKGEALVARAYAHFMLVNLFAKFYDEETASSDPGIPYVKEPETVALKTYERRTVEYVYDNIENDLEEGIELINDQVYKIPAYHFTKSAAHAFAVRYYLYKREYRKVIQHANLVFADNDFASRLRPWNTTYQNLSADELLADYTRATQKANILLCETSSLWARTYDRFRYSTGVNELDEIRSIAGAARGQFAYTIYFYSSINTYYILKFREHFVRADISANTGLPYTIVPLFTAEEVLLSRAEAYAFDRNNSSAISDLNTFFSTRIADYDPAINTVTEASLRAYYGTNNSLLAIVETTLNLRRAEFLHEGLWWFDILRYAVPVTHYTADGEVLELPEDDPRRTLQIPREAISLGNLEPNPR